jgi:hypothetical protein
MIMWRTWFFGTFVAALLMGSVSASAHAATVRIRNDSDVTIQVWCVHAVPAEHNPFNWCFHRRLRPHTQTTVMGVDPGDRGVIVYDGNGNVVGHGNFRLPARAERWIVVGGNGGGTTVSFPVNPSD